MAWVQTERLQLLQDNIGSIRVLEKAGLAQVAPDGEMLKWEIRK